MSGHKRTHVWAQSCVGTIVRGHKRVWAQSCMGPIVVEPWMGKSRDTALNKHQMT